LEGSKNFFIMDPTQIDERFLAVLRAMGGERARQGGETSQNYEGLMPSETTIVKRTGDNTGQEEERSTMEAIRDRIRNLPIDLDNLPDLTGRGAVKTDLKYDEWYGRERVKERILAIQRAPEERARQGGTPPHTYVGLMPPETTRVQRTGDNTISDRIMNLRLTKPALPARFGNIPDLPRREVKTTSKMMSGLAELEFACLRQAMNMCVGWEELYCQN
jgi:hypothetical protein